MAALARAFGMRILVAQRAGQPAATGPDAPPQAPLLEVLRTADVITLHLPLDATTKHLLGRAEFAAMRPGHVPGQHRARRA